MGDRDVAMRISHISKEFGGTKALRDVSLDVLIGQVHGLLGENGSGKSTLIKTLAGVNEPNPGGGIEIYGTPIHWPVDQNQLRRLGVQIVHQELGLIHSLSVAENFAIFRQGELSRFRIGWRNLNRRVSAELAAYDVHVDPELPVERLSPVTRAEVAIVRAVGSFTGGFDSCRLLVLDEPTVFLSQEAVTRLFSLVRALRAEGKSILFVSHDIDEVLEITDAVTVLRDGAVQATRSTQSLSADDLVELILGRRLSSDLARAERGEVVGAEAQRTLDAVVTTANSASVRNLSGGRVRDLSFDVAAGEVLGVTGLVGSGIEEVPHLLIGAKPPSSGTLTLGDVEMDLRTMNPTMARDVGIGHVPADRLRDAAIAELSVEENISLPVLGQAFRGGRLRLSELRRHSDELLERYDVRSRGQEQLFGTLSGGNQQKVVLGICLQESPRLIILHEPTQGIDVGSRQQMAQEIASAAQLGVAVIIASADYAFIADVCQRVLIMVDGREAEQLSGAEVTKRTIAERCLISSHL